VVGVSGELSLWTALRCAALRYAGGDAALWLILCMIVRVFRCDSLCLINTLIVCLIDLIYPVEI
jgi:hypothetical protein